jgi:hypothetical protein
MSSNPSPARADVEDVIFDSVSDAVEYAVEGRYQPGTVVGVSVVLNACQAAGQAVADLQAVERREMQTKQRERLPLPTVKLNFESPLHSRGTCRMV